MVSATDRFDLERFLQAQASHFESALEELRSGQKVGHWMWFVFPQLKGLGASNMARRYAIGSLTEAQAYLAHGILGPRLHAVTAAVLGNGSRPVKDIFGFPDDLKFHSSMTLFAIAEQERNSLFEQALERYWLGNSDDRTISGLAELG